jgi:tetratricopeptide (TPR) repeat protein
LKLGRVDGALEAFGRAGAIDKDHPLLWLLQRVAPRDIAQTDEPLRAFERAVCEALCSLERPQEALETFDRPLISNPNIAAYWWGRGAALLELGRVDGALEAFGGARTIDPDREPPWLLQRVARRDVARTGEPLRAFERAIREALADFWTCGRHNRKQFT